MKFIELSTGTQFHLIPDDGKRYIKLASSLTTGHAWNAKAVSGYCNFSETQLVEIFNNFKRDSLKEL